MLSSFFGIVVMVGILSVPGALMYACFLHKKRFLDTTDRVALVLLLSGLWNLVFFMFRIDPTVRLFLYISALALLFVYFLYTFSAVRSKLMHLLRSSTTLTTCTLLVGLLIAFGTGHLKISAFIASMFFLILIGILVSPFFPPFKQIFVKKHLPIFALVILGIVLVSIPLHTLNLSRLQPNPVGGDVQFFLYKTQLLENGYSIFDDMYADQVTYYPNLIMSHVALTALFTGGDVALHAETFRIIVALLIFVLIYVFGRSLRFSSLQSLLFALSSLLFYNLWSHLDLYVAAGMAFLYTFLFYYFLVRAVSTGNAFLWIIAGLSASMTVHAHPVHGLMAGVISGVALILYCIRYKSLSAFLSYLKGVSPLIIIYLTPLIIWYQLVPSSDFYLTEDFTTTYAEFLMSVLKTPMLMVGFVIAIIASIWHKRFPQLRLASIVYLVLFSVTILLRIFAIFTHRLAIYIDVGDNFTILWALGFTMAIICIGTFFTRYARKITVALIIALSISLLISLDVQFLRHYTNFFGSFKTLSAAEGYRSAEGNLNLPFVDQLAATLEENIPPFTSAVMMHPDHVHSFGSHFGRKIVLYEHAHSTLFLEPPYLKRRDDFMPFYENPSVDVLRTLIKKYRVTHVFFTWSDTPELYRVLRAAPFLENVPLDSDRGSLFKVAPAAL